MMVGEETESISGCQSGWTVYFDQSYQLRTSLPFKNNEGRNHFESKEEKEQSESESEEDDSLSMVSDASSGPPHLDLEEVGCLCTASSSPSNANATLCDINIKKRKVDQFYSPFDDTASSPLFAYNSTTGVMSEMETMAESVSELSCSFSATNQIIRSKKKMKRRCSECNDADTFHSFSSKEQPVQEFL